MAVDELDEWEESNWREKLRGVGRLCTGDRTRLVLAVGGGVLLGVVIGMRIGRAKGEAVGRKQGIELGRLATLGSIPQPQPRTWRPPWRRAA